MELNIIFRRILEEQGIDYLLSERSINYIADLDPTISLRLKYLWRAMVRDGLIELFIHSIANKESIRTLSYKYANSTGFEFEKIHFILQSLSIGMRQAFWGIIPNENEERLRLSELFVRNKAIWTKRLDIYNEGILRIYTNGKYGFITSTGNFFIEPQYKGAGVYSEGLVCVRDFEGQTCFLNILGNKEVEFNVPSTASIGAMKKGVAIYTWVNKSGHYKYGLISRDGATTPPIYDTDHIDVNDSSVLIVRIGDDYGMIRKTDFSPITPSEYSMIYPFKNNHQIYTLAKLKNGHSILLNREGKEYDIFTTTPFPCNFIDSLIFVGGFGHNMIVLNDNLKKKYYKERYIIDNRVKINYMFKTTTDVINSPILIRDAYTSEYIYIKSDGTPLNKTPCSMAHQFNNGIAWIKKGFKWYRINTYGYVLNTLTGFDVLSIEYQNTVLARNLSNGLIVLLSYNGDILFTFPKSEDSDVTLNRYGQYTITTLDNNYIWYKGVLTQINGNTNLNNQKLLGVNYVLIHLENDKYIIYDLENGQSYTFKLQHKTDLIGHNRAFRTLRRGLIVCKTYENKCYIIDVSSNKFSETFDEIQWFSRYPIGRRNGCYFLLDLNLEVKISYEQIVSDKCDI